MRKLSVEVTYKYEIEVDENNKVVKEYETTTELLGDLASYRFSDTLPVMKEGVKVKDIEVLKIEF